MGMFKDLKGMVDVARSDELKDMRRMAQAQPKMSMMDGLKAGTKRSTTAGTAAMHQVSGMQGALADGVAGEARIDAIAPTAQHINGMPVVAFELTITLPGRAGYQARHTQMISPVVMANFQPGATMPVRVAADDPTSMFLGA